MVAVPEWNALLCLVDGALAAFALATFKPLAVLGESKGCLGFHHRVAPATAAARGGGGGGCGVVAVILPKRRLLVAEWESRGGGGGFRVRARGVWCMHICIYVVS